MSASDKASNKVEDLKGRVTENVGHATGDNDLENDGKVDQAKATIKDIGEAVRDAGNKAKRLVER